jgi:predicted house-cleaning noncanonical NTP pyrophosphatase (MazG superfamily)
MMTLKPVLYNMLISYANKEHSPYVDTEDFILFVEKYARHVVNEQPEWTRWAKDASRRIWEDLGPLIEEGKCSLFTEKTGARIYLRRFYIDLLEGAYANPDETASLPFPSEKYFKIKIPPEHIKALNVATDMVTYLDNPQSEQMPLILLVFPPGLPGALALSTMIPRRLSETAMLKIRYFLRIKDNKDYLQNKLIPHYQGREAQVRDLFTRILMRPMDCLNDLESGEDFPYMFWSTFCGLARSDITRKKDLLNVDIAVMQSTYIIEIMNNYFRAQAFRRKEREVALNDLGLEFDRPPYAFSMDAILKFTNSKGVPLLGLYSQEDLQHWLEERIHAATSDTLSEILLITGPADAKRYIKKAHYFTFSVKLLNDARPVIRQAVKDRWVEIIKDYRRELAMEKDEDYERLLQRLVGELTPELMAVLMDKKLYLVCDELEQAQGFIPENSRIFLHGGALLPLATILLIKRKEILAEAKALLPFWYSIPLFVALVTFYHKLKNLRSGKKGKAGKNVSGRRPSGNGNQEQEIKEAGRRLESEMVPFGEEIDIYLGRLENRWNTLLSKQAREDLSTDVRTLVRDRLRQTLHGQRHIMLTRDSLEKLAKRITEENSALRELNNQENLRQFIALYMVKLLIQGKF